MRSINALRLRQARDDQLMSTRDESLLPRYRMPRSFGYAPGPRNLPAHQRHRQYEKEVISWTVSARTQADRLERFLPEGLSLHGEARLEICVMSFSNLGWLAGRGYDIVIVRIPVCWTERQAQGSGCFVPVVWENMADPIITGREELGWSKIFADIRVSDAAAKPWQCSASWDGHRFFEFSASGFTQIASAPTQPAMVFEKYVPATGEPEAVDAQYLTMTVPDGPEPKIHAVEEGQGCFEFRSASWEQMPTQYPIVNALAALPLCDFSRVTKVSSSSGGDGSEQRKLLLGS